MKTNRGLTPLQIPKFFKMAARAANAIGEPVEAYRKRVMWEEVKATSTKEMSRTKDYDACLLRFAIDSGDYMTAIEIDMQEVKRWAYLIKVVAVQLVQLKGGEEKNARNYLEGLLLQARVASGTHTSDDSYFMDVPQTKIVQVFQILDTERRRLIRGLFPKQSLRLDDKVKYEIDGCLRFRQTVEKDYYAKVPFHVDIRKGGETYGA